MTELETIQRAKLYLDKLANGIDPLTDLPVPDTDCINQVRISRCFFFVSDVLRQVIENGGIGGNAKKSKKQPFSISQDALRAFPLSETPIPVSEICRRINELVDQDAMKKLKYTSITAFLLQSGFLREIEFNDGTVRKAPTEQGKAIGISEEERTGQAGVYLVTVYDAQAQQFLLDNIEAIVDINNGKATSSESSAAYQGKPWIAMHDATLIDLFQKNVPVSEIAVILSRSEGAIRARLKKLALIV